jgi:hypothetical protein
MWRLKSFALIYTSQIHHLYPLSLIARSHLRPHKKPELSTLKILTWAGAEIAEPWRRPRSQRHPRYPTTSIATRLQFSLFQSRLHFFKVYNLTLRLTFHVTVVTAVRQEIYANTLPSLPTASVPHGYFNDDCRGMWDNS